VRNIRRATRKHHAAEEKIRIVLDGLRGETSTAELCRREGIARPPSTHQNPAACGGGRMRGIARR
jgi:transposase-like protein